MAKTKKYWKKAKQFWHYVWNGDDMLSWILSIIFAFVIIKFLFYPAIGFALGTSHPIVAVVSGSMEHKIVDNQMGIPTICGKSFTDEQRVSLEEYYSICGDWYTSKNITLTDFESFHFKNGINTGDVIVLRHSGANNIEIGDVIVFIQEQNPIQEPIIHRVVNILEEDGKRIFQTKGDHNQDMINVSTQSKYLNEYYIPEDEVVGKALIKIPFIGYVKIWAYELFIFIRGIL